MCERRIVKVCSVKMVDDAKVKYICDIYDWDGKGEIDLFFLGDVMYALGLNITKKVCVGLGQTDEEGKKFAKYDDVVEKVKAAVATPDSQVGFFDFDIDKHKYCLKCLLVFSHFHTLFLKNLHFTDRQF